MPVTHHAYQAQRTHSLKQAIQCRCADFRRQKAELVSNLLCREKHMHSCVALYEILQRQGKQAVAR